MLSNLTGNASDVGLHTMSVDGERVKLLGDFDAGIFDGKLFVREAGVQLRLFLLDKRLNTGQRCFVATGTPGIGKSSFAVYFAVMLLREGTPVLFQLREDHGILLEPGMAGQLPKATFYNGASANIAWLDLLLDSKNGWYIVDSSKPRSTTLPTLLVTSTQPGLYKDWLKQNAAKPYFMPLPSDNEFLCFRDALRVDLTTDQLFARIGLVGRSFRKVFSKDTNDELRDELDGILNGVSDLNIQNELLTPASDKLLTSSVVHITTEPTLDGSCTFSKPDYVISTARMRDNIVARAFQTDGLKLWAALQKPASGYLSQIRASLFEGVCRSALVLPGCRVGVATWDPNGKLKPPQIMPSPFTNAELREFEGSALSGAGSFLPSEKVLFYPTLSNFPVLDSFGTTGNGTTLYLLQFTISPRRRRKVSVVETKKQKILDEAVELADGMGLCLVFVLVVPQGEAASCLSPELPDGVGAEVWEIFAP